MKDNREEVEKKLEALVAATEELNKALGTVSTTILTIIERLNKAIDGVEFNGYYTSEPDLEEKGGTNENKNT